MKFGAIPGGGGSPPTIVDCGGTDVALIIKKSTQKSVRRREVSRLSVNEALRSQHSRHTLRARKSKRKQRLKRDNSSPGILESPYKVCPHHQVHA